MVLASAVNNSYPQELQVRRAPNKGLSNYRKGFPVKLSKDNLLILHMTYAWMQKHGETTPELDELVKLLPPYSEASVNNWPTNKDRRRAKTLRVRGPEVPTLIVLMERSASLPFKSTYTFENRIRDLKAIGAMDLMVDAQRE